MSGLAGLAGPIGSPGAQGALLYVDANTRDVYVRGRPVALTPKEAALLTVLYERRGSTVGYGTICERVWGWAYSEESATNIHNLVSRLRRKVEAGPGRPALLERRDGGYLLADRRGGPDLAPAGAPVGREEERAALRDLLLPGGHEAPWLVTLVGAPGVGKTSLALQVAEDPQIVRRGIGRRPPGGSDQTAAAGDRDRAAPEGARRPGALAHGRPQGSPA